MITNIIGSVLFVFAALLIIVMFASIAYVIYDIIRDVFRKR